jgi:2-dehydro-3-deoxygluconokinase
MTDFLSFGEPLIGFYPMGGSSIVDDGPITKTWGGDTSNFAIGVARLGHGSAYLTRVGDDPFGSSFLSLWKENGVDCSLVEVDPERRTGLYFVSFEAGKHSLTYYRKDSAASAIVQERLASLSLEGTRIVHLSGISLGMSASALETSRLLIKKAHEAGCKVSFDVNYRVAQWNSREAASEAFSSAILLGVDYLEITDDEMAALDWGNSLAEITSRFPHVATIVLKRGKSGVALSCTSDRCDVPAYDVAVVDTVGAGDSFDAGFLCAMVEGAAPRDACVFAAATAALTCTGRGPLERMPRRHEVVAFLRTHGGLPATLHDTPV